MAGTTAAQTGKLAINGTRVAAILTLLVIASQFITAGQMFPDGGPEDLHAAGAIAIHVFSGLAAIGAIVYWRVRNGSLGLAVLAVVVFGYSFLQAAIGDRDSLWLHIPGALLLAAGSVWLVIWSLQPKRVR